MPKQVNKLLSKKFPVLYLTLKRVSRKLFKSSRGHVRTRIPADMSVEDFFQALKERSVRYVVLRWFEKLPETDQDRDLDLLISDKDVEKVRSLLIESNRGTICDLYSVIGLPGAAYKNMPVFPPKLAEKILDNAVLKDGLYLIPSPEYHFYW